MTLKHIYLYICIVSILISGGTMAFWLLWPYKVVTVNQMPTFTTQKVRAGEVIKFTLDYCKHINVPALVTRQLIDRQVIFLPEMITNLPIGCSKGEREIQLPPMMPPSTYYLHMTTTYKVNPLRSITYVWDSNHFEVVR